MRARALRLLPGAQPMIIPSNFKGVSALRGIAAATSSIAEVYSGSSTGNGNSSTLGAPAKQPVNLTHPSSCWLPAPPTRCNDGQRAGRSLRHAAPEHAMRQYSSSAGTARPTLKTQLRELYKRVHPDRFQDHPVAQVCRSSNGQGRLTTLQSASELHWTCTRRQRTRSHSRCFRSIWQPLVR